MTTTVRLRTDRTIAPVDPRLFGGFVEHLGRAIYGGLYDPDSPHADEEGWRTDVLKDLGPLGFSILRYPGGNFVSGYDWRHGIGPREDRPEVLDEAWNSLEPNHVGTDEFLRLCDRMGWQPMITVNLGSGEPEEAAEWVRYCNRDRRRVQVWCLGNEMDGDWQIGHLPPRQYAEKALRTARLLRKIDPGLELVACGSSNPTMPTWLEWDRIVLEDLQGEADYISLHRYADKNADDDTEDYLAISNDIDRQIEAIDSVCRDVAARTGRRRAYLCFDEWNVWYRTAFKRFSDGGGTFAPHLIEERYNLEDALVVAGFLNSFIRHADAVRVANLAQIVNAIAPIITVGDQAVRQTIYWPFAAYSSRKTGTALDIEVDGPTFDSRSYGPATVVDASAILDGSKLSLFLVNRSSDVTLALLDIGDAAAESIVSAETVTGRSPKVENTVGTPDEVVSRPFDSARLRKGSLEARLEPYSVTAMTINIR